MKKSKEKLTEQFERAVNILGGVTDLLSQLTKELRSSKKDSDSKKQVVYKPKKK